MPYGEDARAVGEVADEQLRHGNFVLRGLGERHADRVADAVGQQGADAYGALDAPLQSVSGLRDAQMDRVAHSLGLHRFDQQPVGGHHDARVARLHRDRHLVELLRAADAQELHRRDDHALRRVAPPVEHPFRERAVVHADAQRHAPGAARVDERLELAAVVAVVARVDAHLVHVLRGDGGHLGREMDVGHHGRRASVGPQLPDDFAEVLAFAAALRREAHDVSAGAVDTFDLGHARGRVVGVGVGHRLHGDGVSAADGHAADAYFARRAAHEFLEIHRLSFSGPPRTGAERGPCKDNIKIADRSYCCGPPGAIAFLASGSGSRPGNRKGRGESCRYFSIAGAFLNATGISKLNFLRSYPVTLPSFSTGTQAYL